MLDRDARKLLFDALFYARHQLTNALIIAADEQYLDVNCILLSKLILATRINPVNHRGYFLGIRTP